MGIGGVTITTPVCRQRGRAHGLAGHAPAIAALAVEHEDRAVVSEDLSRGVQDTGRPSGGGRTPGNHADAVAVVPGEVGVHEMSDHEVGLQPPRAAGGRPRAWLPAAPRVASRGYWSPCTSQRLPRSSASYTHQPRPPPTRWIAAHSRVSSGALEIGSQVRCRSGRAASALLGTEGLHATVGTRSVALEPSAVHGGVSRPRPSRARPMGPPAQELMAGADVTDESGRHARKSRVGRGRPRARHERWRRSAVISAWNLSIPRRWAEGADEARRRPGCAGPPAAVLMAAMAARARW